MMVTRTVISYLHSDICCAKVLFQPLSSLRSTDSALFKLALRNRIWREIVQTMFPASVDPLANNMTTGLQPPVFKSFAVDPTLVD